MRYVELDAETKKLIEKLRRRLGLGQREVVDMALESIAGDKAPQRRL